MTEGLRPPPEGLLLIAARERQDESGHSVAHKTALSAAILKKLGYPPSKLGPLSETYWRSVVGGFAWVGKKKVKATPYARAVARYAYALGVTAEELTAAGRADAADLLRLIQTEVAREEKERRDLDAARRASGNPARVEERWLLLEPLLRQAPVGLDAYERDDLRDRVDGLLTKSAQWQASQDSDQDPDSAVPPARSAKPAKSAKSAKSAKPARSKAAKTVKKESRSPRNR
ncbi:hypothetical protein [Actinacidiphila sp. bgisy145]|uniref:hypothetical protein n=1 Tax=Actinacidiphila sp. bgisy145 TaxID=3413792 RepID=UPI003EC0EA4F